MQCTAKSKATGETCRRRAVTGSTVCQVHGGVTPSGLALPQTTHGRYSRHLPTRMIGRYAESLDDPEPIALRDEIGLTDARLADLLARVDTGEAGAAWANARKAMQEYDRAAESGREDSAYRQAVALQSLRDILFSEQDYEAWNEVHRMVEQRRKLAETEIKRVNQDAQTITADRAMLLIGAILGIVREHVSDRQSLSEISRRVGHLLDSGGDAPARPGLPG